MRYAARVDNNQAEIIAALRRVGCAVFVLKQPLDVLIWAPRRQCYFLADIKNPAERKGTRLTKAQQEFMRTWAGPWYLLRTVDEALELVGSKGNG